VQLRDLARAGQHARALDGIVDRAGEPLQRLERFLAGHADLRTEPRDRLEHFGPIGIELVGLAIRVERARVVGEVLVVDHAHLAIQLGALGIVLDVDRAPVEQLDERRPLRRAAIEQLERLVRRLVQRIDREHALETVGGIVRAAELLPAVGDVGEPPARVVVDLDERGHRLERQLGPAIRDPREPQQRIDVICIAGLAERRESHRKRALGIAGFLEAVRQVAQDARTLGTLLGRLDAGELQIDDAVPLGIEGRVRRARVAALDGRAEPVLVEARELLEDGTQDHVHGAEPAALPPHCSRLNHARPAAC
jgi:hypothetical protein